MINTKLDKPDFSGFLKKKGVHNRGYKRRWFELRSHNLLYFKRKTGTKPAGTITLSQACKAEIDENKKYSFNISGTGLSRTYQITAEDIKDRDDWIDAINKACQGGSVGATESQQGEGQIETIFSKDAKSGQSSNITKDDFDFLKVIGRGSFGKVMLVQLKGTKEIYAMKILKKDMIIKENMVSHTKSEKSILQQIDHPFIVGLKYAFQSREKLYLVLDFLAGGEIFFHLKEETKFPVERAKFYAAELICALGHLHKFDIVYRDLKPENVVLDGDGHVVITDFGLAKTCISNATPTYTFCGTPEYLAPEILKGQGHAKAVDWWSLGILLYEMLVGLPPFYADNIHEMYELILKAPIKYPDFVPNAARDLLNKLLDRDEFKRLGSGKEDAEEIKKHPFFSNIDWKKLEARQMRPPFIPVTHDDPTKYFDEEFTSERAIDSFAEVTEDDDDSFDDFSYNRDHDRRRRAQEQLKL